MTFNGDKPVIGGKCEFALQNIVVAGIHQGLSIDSSTMIFGNVGSTLDFD